MNHSPSPPPLPPTSPSRKQFKVLAIVPRPDGQGEFFLRVGPGYENSDGSINLYVSALPVGVPVVKLQVRELDARDVRDIEAARAVRAAAAGPGAQPARSTPRQ